MTKTVIFNSAKISINKLENGIFNLIYVTQETAKYINEAETSCSDTIFSLILI
jgi:hypothetical protein